MVTLHLPVGAPEFYPSEQVTHVEMESTGNRRNSGLDGRRQPSLGGTSRMNREIHVRLCERLGAKFPGPTRQFPGPTRRAE
jgi:hypothetical protein